MAKRLPRRGRWGTVFAVFQRSCYLESVDGKVFCLADHRLGQGPLTLGIEFPENTDLSNLGVCEGRLLETGGADLRLGRVSLLRTTATVIWEPGSLIQTAPPNEVLRRLFTLADLMEPLIPTDGLAAALPHAASLAIGEPPSTDAMNEVAGLAMPRLRRLSEGLIRSHPETVDEAVVGLLGFGPGLTPSGDDLLGGMLVALRAMPDTASHPSENILAGCVTRHAALKTNRISSAMLKQFALGNGTAAQHRLLNSLLGVDAESDMTAAALDLTRVGHTSGWDILAGILLGTHLGLRIKQGFRESSAVIQETAGVTE